jgi:hypothetical protein
MGYTKARIDDAQFTARKGNPKAGADFNLLAERRSLSYGVGFEGLIAL